MIDEHAERHARERQAEYDIARGATFNESRSRFEYPVPLVDRLASVKTRIARMCREGKPPAMSIPPQPYDDDMFIIAVVEDVIEAMTRPITWKLAGEMTEDARNALFKMLQDNRGPILVVDEEITPDRLPEQLRAAISACQTMACWWAAGNPGNGIEAHLSVLGRWLDGKPEPAAPAAKAADACGEFGAACERGGKTGGTDHG